MMMLIGPSHSRGAHDFRAPREWRAPMKVFFSRGPGSVDSWTPGPKPLCHRRPTGPHPSGLLWTPAKGDSTKSNFALAALLAAQDVVADLGGQHLLLVEQALLLPVTVGEDAKGDQRDREVGDREGPPDAVHVERGVLAEHVGEREL